MYGYRVYLYNNMDPIKTLNKPNFIELLLPWNSRYYQLVGFIKNGKPVSIYSLEELSNYKNLKGSYPVFIQKNGIPKTLSYKIKSVERVSL